MKRREVIAALCWAVMCPLPGRAEEPQPMRRVGVLLLWPENDPMARASTTALCAGISASRLDRG